jgi:uncharacterized protein (TIRG00374 family)
MSITKRSLLIALGIAISATLLVYALKKLDWPEFFAAMARVDLVLVFATVPLLVAGIACRSARWSILNLHRMHFRHYWRAATIGYLGNYILPLRGGEIVRIVVLQRMVDGLGLAQASLSAVVDRAYDLLFLALLVMATWHLHGGTTLPSGTVETTLIVLLLALAAGITTMLTARSWGSFAMKIALKLPEQIANRVCNALAQILATAAILRRPGEGLAALVLSILALATDLIAIVCLFKAFGWNLPISAAITVLTFLQIGSALPAAPGYVGVWQIASIFALGLYGLNETAAIAFSVVHQLALFVLLAMLGLWSLGKLGMQLSSMRAAASRSD